MDCVRAHLTVSGTVQGVCFRAFTREEARALGLSGWVRNLPDGRVEIEAEGPMDRVQALIAWCRQGPPSASVDDVDVSFGDPKGEAGGFAIRRQ
jgi:acylphosphatase